jgi:DNA excision repair protein ERCC-6
MKEGSAEWKKGKGNLDFAKLAFSPDVLARLPGKSYFRDDSIMDDHLALSGKMIALDRCLTQFYKQRDRVLVFSQSTATLDLIQQYIRSKGYSHLRLDGTTDTKKRQGLVDQYQSDETIFVFLMTTKAGGLGLNLTAANKVCVFDVDWNPSYDEQVSKELYVYLFI